VVCLRITILGTTFVEAKLAIKEDFQPDIEPISRSRKKKWDDTMKTDLEALMNENTRMPPFLERAKTNF